MARDIILTRTYPHTIDKVWEAISTSDALSTWLMPNDFALKKGQKFQFRTKAQPGFDGVVRCEVLDFREPEFLEYSWQGGGMKQPTIVSFHLTALGSMETKLEFQHRGFSNQFSDRFIRFILGQGWKKLFRKKLANYLQA